MSAEFIHIDQAHDAMADLIKELNEWKTLADKLYYAVCCEKSIRESGFIDASQCEVCAETIASYRKAADSDES